MCSSPPRHCVSLFLLNWTLALPLLLFYSATRVAHPGQGTGRAPPTFFKCCYSNQRTLSGQSANDTRKPIAPESALKMVSHQDDHVVLDAKGVMGGIMLPPQARQGQPWFWTITATEFLSRSTIGGNRATREQAMAEFKTQLVGCWLALFEARLKKQSWEGLARTA